MWTGARKDLVTHSYESANERTDFGRRLSSVTPWISLPVSEIAYSQVGTSYNSQWPLDGSRTLHVPGGIADFKQTE